MQSLTKSSRTSAIRLGHSALRHRPFNLLRSFALLSLLSIGLITAVSGTLMFRFLSDHLLKRDAVVSMEFIQSVVEQQPQLNFSRPESLTDEDGLGELFKHIVNMPDVVRTNVFVPDGHIIWSSDEKLVGRRFELNHELDEALGGDLVYELSDLREHPKSEYVYFPEGIRIFVENYLPIWNRAHTEVIGVIEIYKLPRILIETLNQAKWLVWVTTMVGGLFLYATLFWIVHRANMVMSEQQERLVESETITALGEMAASVAHSIRNSLASIRSSAELAVEVDDLHTAQDSAQDIITEADRLGQWVRELLLFSRPEGGGLQRLAIDKVFRNTLDGFSLIIAKQSVALDFQVMTPVPPIRGDIPLLEQMFASLIANALEAMPNGGLLSVRIAAEKNGQFVELTISDSGQGIASDQLDKVFKPFFTSKSGGLGLGLSLVRRIVERHRGRIDLSSAENQGTIIRLDFPRAPD